MRVLSFVILGGLLTACGSGSSGGGGAIVAADGGEVFPAAHPPPPQVVSEGGPVLAAPRIVPVFFANENQSAKAGILDFLGQLGGSDYWRTVTQEYGVGPATMATPVEVAETPTGTITDTDVASFLAGKLNSNDPTFPAPDANTVYAIHYPPGVTITAQSGSQSIQSCQEFGGFHADLTLDAAHNQQKVAYAVIPRCDSFNNLSGLDELTVTDSHELIEASTDPYPINSPAFSFVDQDHLIWGLVLEGGEVTDLCTQNADPNIRPANFPFLVARSWSNASASASHDPCVPLLPNEIYFNAVPELNDTVTLKSASNSVTTKGVSIPVGQTKTIPLDLFSDADTGGEWNVEVRDLSVVNGGPQQLMLSLDRTTGRNGDQLQLSIHVLQAGSVNGEPFIVTSALNGQVNFWIGLVGR